MNQEVAPADHLDTSPLQPPTAAYHNALNARLLSQRTQLSLAPPTAPRSPNIRGAFTFHHHHHHPAVFAIPSMLSVETRRIAQLRTYLDPTHRDYQHEGQHVNIRVAIWMGKGGESVAGEEGEEEVVLG
ncbi:hypothetical protein VE02_07634 [Pseudogymnoascus sp. 03VT05]|nr:hypothetical protein VE02_07634 [Pseudogymnoascus sp. 03VT05]